MSFKEEIKNIENEETEALKLQQAYRNGDIKEGELTQEQKDKLIALYDAQINQLQKTIEKRKENITNYKKRLNIVN